MADKKPPASTASDAIGRQRRWPLWSWVATTVAIAAGTAAFSFWWPMYRATRIIDFVEAHKGDVHFKTAHPRWLVVLNDNTFHPWFDRMSEIELKDVPVDDTFLNSIRMFSDIEYLNLNVSSISTPVIDSSPPFQTLRQLNLEGDGEAISLEWINSLPNLRYLLLSNVPLSGVQANLINTLPSLTQLRLQHCEATPQFWALLSKHKKLADLELLDVNLDNDGLEKLGRLSTLKELGLFDCEVSPAAVRKLEERRDHVSIISDVLILNQLDQPE